jgi:uncharacterized protein (DUF2147 family)
MKLSSTLALALLAAAIPGARADAPTTADGFWEVQYDDGKPQGWFLVSHKGDVYYARLVKGFAKEGDDTKPDPICHKCSGEKKGARIMGLTLFWGLKRDGLVYTGGSVMDPRDGSVYHAKMTLSDDGQELAVRGYLGIEMLGKTQTWHRLPNDAMKPKDIPKEVLAKSGPAPAPSPTPTEGESQ